MAKMPPPRPDIGEPPPRFASTTEIALADTLRRRLEESYFGRSVAATTLPARPERKH